MATVNYETIENLWEAISSSKYWSIGETFVYRNVKLKCVCIGTEFAVYRNGIQFDSWSIRLFTKEQFVNYMERVLVASEYQLMQLEY